MKTPIIAPSLLSADFSDLRKDLEMLNRSEADWFHVDVMDGVFVPNISFGFPVLNAIKKYSDKPLDVHLMMNRPQDYIERFAQAGATNLSIHIENETDCSAVISKIKSCGMKAGLAISPGTPVSKLADVISTVDMVILMSVKPGYGGQKFIPESLAKLAELKKLILEKNSPALIEVDGGVDLANAADLLRAGADALVAGNTVFAAPDPGAMISSLKRISQK